MTRYNSPTVRLLLLLLLPLGLLTLFGCPKKEKPKTGAVQDEALAAGRDAASLKAADEDYYKDMDGGVPLTPEELTEQVGLTDAQTQEVLRRLQRLRIVDNTPEGLLVRDIKRLEEFYEFLEMRDKFGDG